MGVRRQSREAALYAIFMCDFLNQWNMDAANFCFDHFSVVKVAREYAEVICQGVIENLTRIDSRLTRASENWSLSRMGRVDRALLRIATFEIEYLQEVPANVAINEAIEIAKRYGAEESPTFINGVLDRVATANRPKSSLVVEVIAEDVHVDGEETIQPILDVEHRVLSK